MLMIVVVVVVVVVVAVAVAVMATVEIVRRSNRWSTLLAIDSFGLQALWVHLHANHRAPALTGDHLLPGGAGSRGRHGRRGEA